MIADILMLVALAAHAVAAFFIGGFWGTAGAWWYYRRIRRVTLRHAVGRLKFFRRWIWPAYALWVLSQFLTEDSWVKSAVYTVAYGIGTWLAWRATKDVDDDFWKKLIEKGLGAVERFGNRLRVVVPAPAGA